MKRAFTLIELLVVIAIIAILAAILFPVFAQAKAAAKKTSAISNMKQFGTGFNVYLADSDDVLPCAFTRRADGSWRNGTIHPFPNGIIVGGGWDTPEAIDSVGSHWSSAVQPYLKNYNIYQMPDQTGAKLVAGDVFKTGVTPYPIGLFMNGFLHKMSPSAVAAPSNAILAWPTGTTSYIGRAFSNPTLACSGTGDCMFNPTGPASSGGTGTEAAYWFNPPLSKTWMYGNGMPMVRVDSSAKYYKVGTQIDPAFHQQSNAVYDVWAAVTKDGYPSGYWPCDDQGGYTEAKNYWCFFRPDRTK